MNDEALLSLALQSIDDADARVVLGDAMREEGFPLGLAPVVAGLIQPRNALLLGWRVATNWHRDYFEHNARSTTTTFVRALVAVLLCRGWQVEPWPAPRVSELKLYSDVLVVMNGRVLTPDEPHRPGPIVIRTDEDAAVAFGRGSGLH